MGIRLFAAAFLVSALACAQEGVVAIQPPAKLTVERGKEVVQALVVDVRPGYHVNSNTPEDEFLIPLKLTWNKGPLEPAGIAYPKPSHEKYAFSDKPLSVFTGKFEIHTRFKAAASADGMGVMTGRLRYQACNEKECLPPKSVNVQLPVGIR